MTNERRKKVRGARPNPFPATTARIDMRCLLAGMVLLSFSSAVHAQGVLTISPPRSLSTTAGTGAVGLGGTTPTTAIFSGPSGIAYDATGNLYIADSLNHVIRKVTPAGVVSIVAGTGVEGFSGDGSAATSAQLDTPKGVAVDTNGNLYIADSRNNRIRKVTGTTITTVAGTGVVGSAITQLALPSGIAVDATGNLYIADTNNNRIVKITGSTPAVFAGTGQEGYTGDGAAATSAQLDTPTGVAVDSAGNVYIADRHNQAVRRVASGTITTIAGTGASFAGSYSGDGGSATAAALAKPTSVAVDAAGNIYVADTNNQRVRLIANSTISTLAGTGQQGYAGDGAAPASAILNAPQGAAVDATGNLSIADTLNQRIRSTAPGVVLFPSTGVGATSAPQNINLGNSGTASLTVSSLSVTGPFAIVSGGTCSATPITIAGNGSCTINLVFSPTAVGLSAGSASATSGTLSQGVSLSGTSTKGIPSVALGTSAATVPAGAYVTFTATVTAPGSGTPTPGGQIHFQDNGVTFGTVTLASGSATYTTNALGVGGHPITAMYVGDGNYQNGTSSILTETIVSATPPYIWIANGNATVSKISSNGVPFSPSNGFAGGGTAIAIDGSGNVWSGNTGSVEMFNKTGAPATSFSGGGIATPAAIAIAGDGSVWIANTNNTLSTLANNGTTLSPSAGYASTQLSTPSSMAIDNAGNIWVTNAGDSSLTEFVGAADPVATPLATAVKNGTQGVKP
jgi:sugar lactone lactonase YvrE